MSKAHTDGVLALLTGIAGLTNYDAKVPADPDLPYTVLFTDAGLEDLGNLEMLPDRLDVQLQITASGLTRTSVQTAADKAHTAVIGKRPTVAGRTCGVIHQTGTRPIELDKDVNPPLFYAANQYAFYSVAS